MPSQYGKDEKGIEIMDKCEKCGWETKDLEMIDGIKMCWECADKYAWEKVRKAGKDKLTQALDTREYEQFLYDWFNHFSKDELFSLLSYCFEENVPFDESETYVAKENEDYLFDWALRHDREIVEDL